MKTIKLSHLLFSLAVIAALVAAALPAAPAYALTNSTPQTVSVSATSPAATALTVGVTAVVCWNKVIWRDGHRVSIRVCKRVHKPDTHAQ
ncbi:MAG: hypothetical protein IT313_04565 [Anaerolineales bacterium]|nr:hypothetical protein [Anaerolineales bacterium]